MRNIGTYRMQVFDGRSTGMHWQRHKGARSTIVWPNARGSGCPWLWPWARSGAGILGDRADARGLDELMLAGFLRRERVELVAGVTVDLEVPRKRPDRARGYVEPGERRRKASSAITPALLASGRLPGLPPDVHHPRKRPVYLTTVVGIPPMEDYYLGKASERIFLPLIRKTVPEIVDMHFPAEGIFHNLVIISMDKRYPGHAKDHERLLGLGQLMFSKTIIVVDKDVDVQNLSEVAWIVGTHYDPERDIQFTRGPVDDLEDASDLPATASKMGIDATRKWPSEGFTRPWPKKISTTAAAAAALADAQWLDPERMASVTTAAVAERLAHGEKLQPADAENVLGSHDLVAVGVLADEIRRARHGRDTTFVRVFEAHVDACPRRFLSTSRRVSSG